jgi:hypothetical protein
MECSGAAESTQVQHRLSGTTGGTAEQQWIFWTSMGTLDQQYGSGLEGVHKEQQRFLRTLCVCVLAQTHHQVKLIHTQWLNFRSGFLFMARISFNPPLLYQFLSMLL